MKNNYGVVHVEVADEKGKVLYKVKGEKSDDSRSFSFEMGEDSETTVSIKVDNGADGSSNFILYLAVLGAALAGAIVTFGKGATAAEGVAQLSWPMTGGVQPVARGRQALISAALYRSCAILS